MLILTVLRIKAPAPAVQYVELRHIRSDQSSLFHINWVPSDRASFPFV